MCTSYLSISRLKGLPRVEYLYTLPAAIGNDGSVLIHRAFLLLKLENGVQTTNDLHASHRITKLPLASPLIPQVCTSVVDYFGDS